MTLNQLRDLKRWHVSHRRDHPLEYQVFDVVLTLWLLGWVGAVPTAGCGCGCTAAPACGATGWAPCPPEIRPPSGGRQWPCPPVATSVMASNPAASQAICTAVSLNDRRRCNCGMRSATAT